MSRYLDSLVCFNESALLWYFNMFTIKSANHNIVLNESLCFVCFRRILFCFCIVFFFHLLICEQYDSISLLNQRDFFSFHCSSRNMILFFLLVNMKNVDVIFEINSFPFGRFAYRWSYGPSKYISKIKEYPLPSLIPSIVDSMGLHRFRLFSAFLSKRYTKFFVLLY